MNGLIQLSDRYDRLQTGRSTTVIRTNSFSFGGPSGPLHVGMNACADRKEYSEVIKLLDYWLAAARRKVERQSPGAATRARRAAYSGAGGAVPIRVSNAGWITHHIGHDDLSGGERVSRFKHDHCAAVGVTSFINRPISRAIWSATSAACPRRRRPPADAIYPRLSLSAILWWSDEKDEAIAELTKVVNAGRPESDLRLDLAGLLLQQALPADAIELLDAVQPMDNSSLKRREELAITAAIAAGNTERARRAAERLFGLRLDTDTQIRLSGQMHQLGLHELADALLGRARRRAGGQGDALVSLMTQYQRQGKLEPAAQVAMQVLRATRTNQVSLRNFVVTLDADSVRTTAMRVLAASGRLPQLIRAHARAAQEDAQLGRDPPHPR